MYLLLISYKSVLCIHIRYVGGPMTRDVENARKPRGGALQPVIMRPIWLRGN